MPISLRCVGHRLYYHSVDRADTGVEAGAGEHQPHLRTSFAARRGRPASIPAWRGDATARWHRPVSRPDVLWPRRDIAGCAISGRSPGRPWAATPRSGPIAVSLMAPVSNMPCRVVLASRRVQPDELRRNLTQNRVAAGASCALIPVCGVPSIADSRSPKHRRSS